MWQIIASICFILTISAQVQSFENVKVHYHQRPPFYIHQDNGIPSGLVANPIVQAFQRANIKISYVETPAKRQMMILTQNQGRDCAIGWYKNPRRAAVLRFSVPVYQDQIVAVAFRKNDTRVAESPTLNQLFQSPLIWLKKSAYSYGQEVDKLSLKFNPSHKLSSMENLGLIQMLIYQRADYLLMAPEELADLFAQHPRLNTQIDYRSLRDLHTREHRYLVCSQRVEPELIEQLNVELTKLTTQN